MESFGTLTVLVLILHKIKFEKIQRHLHKQIGVVNLPPNVVITRKTTHYVEVRSHNYDIIS